MDQYDQHALNRLLKKRVVTESGCWEWQGTISNGYGKIYYSHGFVYVHRLSLMLLNYDEYKKGPYTLHKCNNRKCFNPEHLYGGTASDNSDDTIKAGNNVNASKTHCIYGHEFTEENTFRDSYGRHCRKCIKERNDEWRRTH